MKANSFFIQISKIFSATVVAHLITIAFSPLLSRMYSPEAFGILAFVLSVANPLTSLANFRLDQAVFLPEKDDDARKVIALANTSSIVFCAFGFLLISIFYVLNTDFQIAKHVVIVLLILTIAIQMPLNTYLQRQKKFNAVSTGKIIQTLSISGLSVALSFFFSAHGLSVAYWLGWLVYLIYIFYKTKIDNINRFSLAELKTTFKKYKHFPLYHAIPTVISSFTLSIPVFYFNQYFSENEIGWFNFARQTLLIPVTLMATAVAQVYFGRVVEMARAKQHIMPSYLKLKAVFALLAIAMIFTISFYGSELFSIVFGANWIQSGQYSKYLVVSAGLQLLVWPLNIIPIALGKIKQNSGFQIIHFILIGLIFLIQPKNPTSAIHYLIAIDVLFFLAYGLFIFYCVKNNDQRLQAI